MLRGIQAKWWGQEEELGRALQAREQHKQRPRVRERAWGVWSCKSGLMLQRGGWGGEVVGGTLGGWLARLP